MALYWCGASCRVHLHDPLLVLVLVLVLLVLLLSTGGSQAADLHPSRCEGVAGTVDPICDCLP